MADVFKQLEAVAPSADDVYEGQGKATAGEAASSSTSSANGTPRDGGGTPHGHLLQPSTPSSKFLASFLRLLRAADVGKLVAEASLDQLDELNRVLCRPAVTELERKLVQASREAQPTIKMLLTASGDDHGFKDGEENNDGGLYDGGIISELLGPEGHRAVVHKAVDWAVTAASYAPASPPDGTGDEVIDDLHRFLCCGGFIHGLGIDNNGASSTKRSTRDLHALVDNGGSGGGHGSAAAAAVTGGDAAAGHQDPSSPSSLQLAGSATSVTITKTRSSLHRIGDDFGRLHALPPQAALRQLHDGAVVRLRELGECVPVRLRLRLPVCICTRVCMCERACPCMRACVRLSTLQLDWRAAL